MCVCVCVCVFGKTQVGVSVKTGEKRYRLMSVRLLTCALNTIGACTVQNRVYTQTHHVTL